MIADHKVIQKADGVFHNDNKIRLYFMKVEIQYSVNRVNFEL